MNSLDVEPRLLDEARSLMARLPFDQIDVLVVGELGKNYSGTGLDPNVIGRQRVETMPDLPRPVITRLAVLDLSVETRGNALGIGLADLTTERLVRQIDPTPMRVNSLTSNFLTRRESPSPCRPIATWSRRASIPAGGSIGSRPGWFSSPTRWNSLHCGSLHPCQPTSRRIPTWSSRPNFVPIPFGADGSLEQESLFPESHRARRR